MPIIESTSKTSFKRRIFDVVELSVERKTVSWYFDILIISLILLSCLAIILESIPSLDAEYHELFRQFEYFCVIVFSIEYVMRLYSITEAEAYQDPFFGRIKYSLSGYAIIDLLAILPFYIAHFFADGMFLRVLRLLRFVRLLKIFRFLNSLTIIDDVIRAKKDELIISFIIILKVLFLSSTIMYYCENGAQPDRFSSIPETMWWAMMTLTTVGYGDIVPVTIAGKVISAIISLIGICLFALPTAILASGFTEQIENRRELNKPKPPPSKKHRRRIRKKH